MLLACLRKETKEKYSDVEPINVLLYFDDLQLEASKNMFLHI